MLDIPDTEFAEDMEEEERGEPEKNPRGKSDDDSGIDQQMGGYKLIEEMLKVLVEKVVPAMKEVLLDEFDSLRDLVRKKGNGKGKTTGWG